MGRACRVQGAYGRPMIENGIPAKCPRCGAPVLDWSPARIQNRLSITLLPCRHQFNGVGIVFPQQQPQTPPEPSPRPRSP